MGFLKDLLNEEVGILIEEELRSLKDPEYNLFKWSLRRVQEIGGSVLIDRRSGNPRLQLVDPRIFKGPTRLIEFANTSGPAAVTIIDENNTVLISMETK